MARSRRGRGEGGVYQRESDGRWVGSLSLGFDARGKRIRKTVYGSTKAEAQQKLRAAQSKFDAGQLAGDDKLTVGAWLDHWLAVIAPSVEPGTLATYRSHVTVHVRPRPFAKMRLARVRRVDIEGFYALLLADGVSPAMTRKIGTTLVVALNHAVGSGVLVASPAHRVRKPKAPRATVEVFDPTQAAAVGAACEGRRLGPLFHLMLDGGLGPGESFALDWPDVDLVRRTVRVTKSLEDLDGKRRLKAPKTDRRNRTVDVSGATVAVLARHRDAMLAEGRDVTAGPVFCDTDGGRLRLSNVHRRDWKPLLKAAGLPDRSLYALRHTCASLLLLAGVNPKVVSERLGHSTVTMTLNTYSHVLPTLQREAADIMGRLLAGTPKAAEGDPEGKPPAAPG